MIHNTDGIKAIKELDEDIDLLITDPPYNISTKKVEPKNFTDYRNPDKIRKRKLSLDFGKWDYDFDEDWIYDVQHRVKGWVIIFCAKQQISTYLKALESKFIATGVGVWRKPNKSPYHLREKFWDTWEAFVYGKRPSTKFNGYKIENIFEHPVNNHNRIHPTQKPVPLFEELISYTSNGGLIADPFAGSGTTAIACQNMGLRYYCCEIDEVLCRKANQRLNKFIQAKGTANMSKTVVQ